MGEVQGIDSEAVTAWYAEHVPGTTPPLEFDLIAGGHSNLTYRSPTPTGGHGPAPPAARPGAGHRPRHGPRAPDHRRPRRHRHPGRPAARVRPGRRRSTARPSTSWTSSTATSCATQAAAERSPSRPGAERGDSLIDVLAAIHAVDVDAVGLGDLGRKEGYIERQLKRWYGQWDKSKTRELPDDRRGPRRARRQRPRAGPRRHRPRRLPARQLHGRRPTARSSPCSTGSSARWATPSPTSAC